MPRYSKFWGTLVPAWVLGFICLICLLGSGKTWSYVRPTPQVLSCIIIIYSSKKIPFYKPIQRRAKTHTLQLSGCLAVKNVRSICTMPRQVIQEHQQCQTGMQYLQECNYWSSWYVERNGLEIQFCLIEWTTISNWDVISSVIRGRGKIILMSPYDAQYE